jgi:Fe-S-cluster containining protein
MSSVLVRQSKTGVGERGILDNPCLNCLGHCCSQNLINVCGYDAWLIATGLTVEPTSFLAFAQMEADSPYHFRLDSSEEAYCLALNMREQPDGRRCCIFLMELPNGQTRCGIYGLRPIACRAYPLTLTEDEVTVKPWAMCPEEYLAPTHPDIASWHAELERHDMEFSIYALVVETWNGKVKDQPAIRELDFRPFLDFLMDIYWRLEPARRAVPEESWPPIWSRWRRFTAEGLNPLLARADDSQADESWQGWLHDIRKAVADSAKGIGGNGVESSKRCEETLV